MLLRMLLLHIMLERAFLLIIFWLIYWFPLLFWLQEKKLRLDRLFRGFGVGLLGRQNYSGGQSRSPSFITKQSLTARTHARLSIVTM